MSQNPPCEEKADLLNKYAIATEIYAIAVRALANNVATTPSEYAEPSGILDQGFEASLKARNQLQRHIAQHGC